MEELNSHAIEIEEVVKKLNASIEKGLTEAEVQARVAKYGKNELVQQKGKTAWQIFIAQFQDFLIYLLIFAIVISVIIGAYEGAKNPGEWPSEYTDAIVIAAILIVNAVLGFYQEY